MFHGIMLTSQRDCAFDKLEFVQSLIQKIVNNIPIVSIMNK